MYADKLCFTSNYKEAGGSRKHKNKYKAHRNVNAEHLQHQVIQLDKTIRKIKSWEARFENTQDSHHSCILSYKQELDAMERKLNDMTSKLKESSEKIKFMELRLNVLELRSEHYSIAAAPSASNKYPFHSQPLLSLNGVREMLTPVSSKSKRKRRSNYDVLAASEKYTTSLGFPKAVIGSKISFDDHDDQKTIKEEPKPLDPWNDEHCESSEISQVDEVTLTMATGRKSKRSRKIINELEKPHSVSTIGLSENHEDNPENQDDKNDHNEYIPRKLEGHKNQKHNQNKKTVATEGVVISPAKLGSPRALQLSIPAPYKCLVCDKIFAAKSSLSRHATTHSAVQPFDCSVCSISFGTKDDLWNHSLRHKTFRNGEGNIKDSKVVVSFSETTKPMASTRTTPRKSAEDTTIENDANFNVISKRFKKRSIKKLETDKTELQTGASTNDGNIENNNYQIDTQNKEPMLREELNTVNVQEGGYCDEYECPLCLKHFMKSENLISHIERHNS